MPRAAYGEDNFRPLVEAIKEAGGELSAAAVCQVLQVKDKRNLARAVQKAIDLDLVHRSQRGPNARYRLGPDPSAKDKLGDFEPALYGDGTVVLTNCPLDRDGDPCLNRAQAARLKALLIGAVV